MYDIAQFIYVITGNVFHPHITSPYFTSVWAPYHLRVPIQRKGLRKGQRNTTVCRYGSFNNHVINQEAYVHVH